MFRQKIKILSIFLISFFLVSSRTWAETFTLKSGKEIEGKIITKTKDYVKINTGKRIVKIRLNLLSEESAGKLKSKSKYTEFLENKGLLRKENYDKDSVASWTGWYMTTQYYINQIERNYYEMHRLTQRLWKKLRVALRRKDRQKVAALRARYIQEINALIDDFENVRPPTELKRYHQKILEYQKFIKKIPDTVLLLDGQAFLITHKRAIRSLLEAQEELEFLFKKYGAPDEKLEEISATVDMLEKVMQIM